ncbi:MAG: hypothetical protein OXS33_11820, partial [bacterium]|nr:hypothetical protein [bacterium]
GWVASDVERVAVVGVGGGSRGFVERPLLAFLPEQMSVEGLPAAITRAGTAASGGVWAAEAAFIRMAAKPGENPIHHRVGPAPAYGPRLTVWVGFADRLGCWC